VLTWDDTAACVQISPSAAERGLEVAFSREYRQLFGSPPSQDIARLREDADLRLAGRP
jgi:hypothetical protein